MTDRDALRRAIKMAATEKANYMALGRPPGSGTYQEAMLVIAENRLELLALVRKLVPAAVALGPSWAEIHREAKALLDDIDGVAP